MKINREQVLERMAATKIAYASLFKSLDDNLAALYHVTPSGKLVDYNNKPVPKSASFEGWMDYDKVAQKPIKVAFTEEKTNIG